MSNLIVTIIGIAVIAIAAIMGVYYGGIAYQNSQINAVATSIINESQQILAAERMWAVKNNQPDISPLAGNSGIITSAVGPYDDGIDTFISDRELSSWPSLAGNITLPATGTVPGSPIDDTCYSIQGYKGEVLRYLVAYQSLNYVVYQFYINVPYNGTCPNNQTSNGSFSASTTDVSQANHPIVKIAQVINNTLKQIPSGVDLSRMPYVGLPDTPAGSYVVGSVYNEVLTNANPNVIQTNYCYLLTVFTPNAQQITCVFGPS